MFNIKSLALLVLVATMAWAQAPATSNGLGKWYPYSKHLSGGPLENGATTITSRELSYPAPLLSGALTVAKEMTVGLWINSQAALTTPITVFAYGGATGAGATPDADRRLTVKFACDTPCVATLTYHDATGTVTNTYTATFGTKETNFISPGGMWTYMAFTHKNTATGTAAEYCIWALGLNPKNEVICVPFNSVAQYTVNTNLLSTSSKNMFFAAGATGLLDSVRVWGIFVPKNSHWDYMFIEPTAAFYHPNLFLHLSLNSVTTSTVGSSIPESNLAGVVQAANIANLGGTIPIAAGGCPFLVPFSSFGCLNTAWGGRQIGGATLTDRSCNVPRVACAKDAECSIMGGENACMGSLCSCTGSCPFGQNCIAGSCVCTDDTNCKNPRAPRCVGTDPNLKRCAATHQDDCPPFYQFHPARGRCVPCVHGTLHTTLEKCICTADINASGSMCQFRRRSITADMVVKPLLDSWPTQTLFPSLVRGAEFTTGSTPITNKFTRAGKGYGFVFPASPDELVYYTEANRFSNFFVSSPLPPPGTPPQGEACNFGTAYNPGAKCAGQNDNFPPADVGAITHVFSCVWGAGGGGTKAGAGGSGGFACGDYPFNLGTDPLILALGGPGGTYEPAGLFSAGGHSTIPALWGGKSGTAQAGFDYLRGGGGGACSALIMNASVVKLVGGGGGGAGGGLSGGGTGTASDGGSSEFNANPNGRYIESHAGYTIAISPTFEAQTAVAPSCSACSLGQGKIEGATARTGGEGGSYESGTLVLTATGGGGGCGWVGGPGGNAGESVGGSGAAGLSNFEPLGSAACAAGMHKCTGTATCFALPLINSYECRCSGSDTLDESGYACITSGSTLPSPPSGIPATGCSVNNDCFGGQTCNAGTCGCTDSAQCPNSQTCTDGACKCTSSSQCSSGETCVNNFCSCSNNSSCSSSFAGKNCYLQNSRGQCFCLSNSECGPGTQCIKGLCRCISHADCGAGSFCGAKRVCTTGTCTVGSLSCMHGQTCDGTRCICANNSQCPEGLTCSTAVIGALPIGTCVCSTNANCPQGRVCSDGRCVVATTSPSPTTSPAPGGGGGGSTGGCAGATCSACVQSAPGCGFCANNNGGGQCVQGAPNGPAVALGCALWLFGQPSVCPASCPSGQFFCSYTNSCLATGSPCGGCSATTPTKCPDGSCVATPQQCACQAGTARCPAPNDHMCVTNVATQCSSCPAGTLRCPDGSCKTSFGECPCPPNSPVKCPTGQCVGALSQCSTTACPAGQIRCWDNACVPSIDQCSCPSSLPVKCAADSQRPNACVATAAECTASCPATASVVCWDGTCASSFGSCPCPTSSPTRCPASTPNAGKCVSVLEDCSRDCVAPRVRCWDGSCMGNFGECPCPTSSPVRCPSGLCAVSTTACASCPAGQITCWNNKCASNFALCDCPPNNPFRCPDNRCVGTAEMCTATGTAACPPTAPIACWDGACVVDRGRCTCPPQLPVQCPDRRCALTAAACATTAGAALCPATAPVRCWDNACVRDPILCTCPSDKPIRCKDAAGNPQQRCVSVETECSTFCPATTPVPCWDGTCQLNPQLCSCPPDKNFKCDDGKCVSLPEQCPRFTSSCETEMPVLCGGGQTCVRCPDRSCRRSASECTSGQPGCPAGTIMCPNQQCARSFTDCPAVRACTGFTCATGECVPDRSLCPSGISCPPDRPFRCPDGKCEVSVTSCAQLRSCPSSAPFLCSDQSCVGNSNDCPKGIVCPPGFFLCSDRSCRRAPPGSLSNGPEVACASAAQCPQATCPDGSCATTASLCPARPTCTGRQIMCPDGSCRPPESCPPPSTCPRGLVQCPGGLCAPPAPPGAPFDANCPNALACPPSSPVMCPDRVTCVVTSSECPAVTSCGANSVQCPDGSCAGSVSRCPSAVSCPSGMVLCADRSCQVSVDACPSSAQLMCPPSAPVRCPSGSCVAFRYLCPPSASCPPGTPVKCFDRSCARTLSDCPTFSGRRCPEGQVQCESGACAASLSQCAVPLMCPNCPQLRLPIKCGSDGSCKGSVAQCPPPFECPAAKPVRCPDASCAATAAECASEVFCTGARGVRCWDNTCRRLPCDCPAPPLCDQGDKIYLCKANGKCVANLLDEEACPRGKTCPAATPFLCDSGTCVAEPTACEASAAACPSDKVFCRGSCVSVCEPEACPEGTEDCGGGAPNCAASCPVQPTGACSGAKPFLCRDRVTCVASRAECVAFNSCPLSAPVLCLGGACAVSNLECPPAPPQQDGACASVGVKCHDGSCASSFAACPLVPPCPASKAQRCGDGVCRSDCAGIANTCGVGLVRCANGACAAAVDLCPAASGCPQRRPVRCSRGGCGATEAECSERDASSSLAPSGCPRERPFRCWDGRCQLTENHCRDRTTGCPKADVCPAESIASCVPVRCPNGSCVADASTCPAETTCPEGKVRCPNRSCAGSLSECETLSGCPVSARFVCPDGTCVREPKLCKAAPVCQGDRPVLCEDHSCQADSSLCPVVQDCRSGEVRCPNQTCAKDLASCVSGCGPGAPFLCAGKYTAGGVCVTDPSLCPVNPCASTPDTSFFCFDGQCVARPSDCAQACSPGKFLCADGLCVDRPSNCTISTVAACPATIPVRCRDGTCVASEALCAAPKPCEVPTQIRCEADGLCRDAAACPPYDGCPAGSVQCVTGRCAPTLDACSEQCPPPEVPCGANRACTNDTSLCVPPKYQRKALPVQYTVDCTVDRTIPVTASDGTVLGRIEIPAGALECNSSYASLDLAPLSDSYVRTIGIPGDDDMETNTTRRGDAGLRSGAFSAELPPELLSRLKKPLKMCLTLSSPTTQADLDGVCIGFVNNDGMWECQCPNPELQSDGLSVCCSVSHLSHWSSMERCNGKLDTCGVCNGDDSTCSKYGPAVNLLTEADFIRLVKCFKEIGAPKSEQTGCMKQTLALFLVAGLFIAYFIGLYFAHLADKRGRRKAEVMLGEHFKYTPSSDKVTGWEGEREKEGESKVLPMEEVHPAYLIPPRPKERALRVIYDHVVPVRTRRDDGMGYIFFKNLGDMFLVEHTWLAMVFVPETASFTRVHRLTVLLIIILFDFAANAFFYRPGDLDILQSMIQGAFASLAAVPVAFVAVSLFLSSKRKPGTWEDSLDKALVSYRLDLERKVERALSYKKNDEDEDDEFSPLIDLSSEGKRDVRKREREIGGKKLLDRRDLSKRTSKKALDRMYRFNHLLPWWFRFVAYAYCIVIALGSALLIVVYGIGFEDSTQQSWIVSSSVAIGQDIIINEPLKIVMKAFVSVFFGALFERIVDGLGVLGGG